MLSAQRSVLIIMRMCVKPFVMGISWYTIYMFVSSKCDNKRRFPQGHLPPEPGAPQITIDRGDLVVLKILQFHDGVFSQAGGR